MAGTGATHCTTLSLSSTSHPRRMRRGGPSATTLRLHSSHRSSLTPAACHAFGAARCRAVIGGLQPTPGTDAYKDINDLDGHGRCGLHGLHASGVGPACVRLRQGSAATAYRRRRSSIRRRCLHALPTPPHWPPATGPTPRSHTAGTVGSVGNNGVGITGAAWNVSLLICKASENGWVGACGCAVAASRGGWCQPWLAVCDPRAPCQSLASSRPGIHSCRHSPPPHSPQSPARVGPVGLLLLVSQGGWVAGAAAVGARRADEHLGTLAGRVVCGSPAAVALHRNPTQPPPCACRTKPTSSAPATVS